MDDRLSMDRRRFLQLSGMASMGVVLAACGVDGATDTTPGTTSPAGPGTTLNGGPAIDADIAYWNYFASATEAAALDDSIAAFRSRYSDANVTSEGIPLGDYFARVVTAAEARSLPQTGQVVLGTLADTVALGAVLDLTDQIRAWEKYDVIPQSLWDEASVDGRIYGIPMFAFVGWLYYRKDWLDEAEMEPPTTWEEFGEAAIAMTDPSQGRYGYGMRGGAGGGYNLTNLIESFGGVIVDDSGSPALERDVVVEAIGFYSSLHTEHGAVPPSVADDSFQQLMTGFKTGQTGMISHHTGSFVEISEVLEPGVEFATVPMPSGPGGTASRVAGQLNSIMSEEDFDTSWAWLTHWGETETQVEFRKSVGQFPSSLEASQDPSVADDEVYSAAVEVFGEAPSATSFVGLGSFQSDHMLPAFQRVLVGTATVEEAADDILAGLDEVTS